MEPKLSDKSESVTDTRIRGYTIDALIFDGDPTRIYRGRRESDGLRVMLKCLDGERAAREAEACLKHEFEMTRRMQVPSVIRVYALERHGNLPVVVFEDFGGDSLNNLAKQRRFSLEEILRIGVDLARGLAEIHAANIIHKDINPSNLVYNGDTGELKIIDFGISTYLTREQAAIANPQVFEASLPYVSPEQTGRMNRSIDYRTDFYSFGATLYELLSGYPLFSVDEPIEWFHCHIAKQPRPLGEANPDIPQALSDIVMKMLAKMAEDRYQSAHGIQADLQRCLDSLAQLGRVVPFTLGIEDVPHRFQIPQRLYGRRAEVAQLLSSFDRISQGGNELILVSGYSGIGKTCVIRELYKPITERRGLFVAGKFDQLHRNIPYSAIAAALRDLVRQLLTESEDQLGVWRLDILQALGANAQLMVDIVGELEVIIGPQPRMPELPAVEAKQRFQHVFHSFIQVFAKPAHPLAIFLDDLQWADSASLYILETLTNPSSAISHLLVIGAFRDNEVYPGHPLQLSLKDMRQNGSAVDEISLRPLSQDHLRELLADTMKADPVMIAPLAQLLEQKTAGNPFFIEEFLKFLHREELITFSRAQAHWTWDIDRIHTQQMTDNVVELMTAKVRELAPEAQALLQLAACIGNRFKLSVLAVVSQQSPKAVARRIGPGMTEGLIAPIGDAYQLVELEKGPHAGEVTVELAFAHDRIQQAAYSLLDADSRTEAHLKIGRLLQHQLPPKQQNERVFEITNHLNLGATLISNAQERAGLCRLNLEAGKRAKASTAYQPAFLYLQQGVKLLEASAWEDSYELALTLHSECAEAAYLSDDYETMDSLLQSGFAGARNLLDKKDLYLVQISSLVARGQLREAVAIAKPVLAGFGQRYPAKANKLHVLAALAKTMWGMHRTSIDQLRRLPETTNPNVAASADIGARIGGAAMFIEPHLLSLMILRSVELTRRYGLRNTTPSSLVAFGMILATKLNKPKQGLAFGKLAMELVDRLDAKAVEGRVLHVHHALVHHWAEPIRSTLEPLDKAYRLCLANGDFEYALMAIVMRTVNAFDAGMNLAQWHDETTEHRAAAAALKQGTLIDFVLAYQQLVDNLRGNSDEPTVLVGRFYDVEKKLLVHQKSGDKALLLTDLILQSRLSYLFGNYRAALAQAPVLKGDAGSIGGFYQSIPTCLFDSLIRLGFIGEEQPADTRKLLKQIQRNQARMKRWAQQNPANCLNKYILVEAERHRVGGRHFEAHGLYDEAAGLAREQGFMLEQALANELCGAMHMRADRQTLGEPYLMKARDLYRQWGAQAKVDQLHQRFPKLIPSVHKSGTHAGALVSFDITSLMKALKAIADEKVHSRMVETIIATAVEFAGAQEGVLILRNPTGELCIEGEASIDGDTPRILQSVPLVQANLPQTLLNYVTRTRSSVVVHDAQQPFEAIPALATDPYVERSRSRSLLCLPIVSGAESELIGALYLENNLASGTFTQERFDTLEIIVMAAAGRLELSRKAAIDGLTALFNHEYFQNMLDQEFASARRHKRELSLILIDIDHFKRFNDTWGHQAGDQVLRQVAQAIRTTCRGGDVVARYGGEEMVVILPTTSSADAEQAAERIRLAVESLRVPHEKEQLAVTISLGLASLDSTMISKNELVLIADKALYRSKADGRNRVTVA